MTKLDRDLIEVCADAFMAAWTAICAGQALVQDTLERVLANQEVADDVWSFIKQKYYAQEYPLGVFNFPNDSMMKIRRLVIISRADHRYPKLVEFYTTLLQNEACA